MISNRILGFSIVGALLLCSITLSAQDTLDKWTGYKAIELKGESKYKSVPLDQDIYMYAQSDLSDVRIVDDHDDFVPFFVKTGFVEENKSVKTIKAQEINFFEEFNEEKTKLDSIFDFQIVFDDKKASKEEKLFGTTLRLKFDSKDFSNQVEVFGRDAKGDWVLILKDTIYDLGDYEKSTIEFGREYYYKFYRVKIIDNKEKIGIARCDLVANIVKSEKKKYLEEENLDFSVVHNKNATLITVKNIQNLKLKNIDLVIEGNFDRRFEFYSYKNTGEDSGKKIENRYPQSKGNIYNYIYNEIDLNKTAISLKNLSTEKEFYINILNYDNKPLKIKEIHGEYFIDYLVFEETESKEYKIYFGNKEAALPSYDIETFKKYIEKETIDICATGDLNLQEVKEEKPKKEINFKLILNIFIIVASILMGVLIIFKLKKK